MILINYHYPVAYLTFNSIRPPTKLCFLNRLTLSLFIGVNFLYSLASECESFGEPAR
jgi:hypothetical protein